MDQIKQKGGKRDNFKGQDNNMPQFPKARRGEEGRVG